MSFFFALSVQFLIRFWPLFLQFFKDHLTHRALARFDSCSGKSWYASDGNIITATVGFCHRPWGCDEGV